MSKMRKKKMDFLSSETDDDDDVSDVDPEELQKMLEGLDFSDSEDMLGGKSSSKNSTAQVPKTSNLKSSIKTSGNGGGSAVAVENQRKVQFSKDTKDQEKEIYGKSESSSGGSGEAGNVDAAPFTSAATHSKTPQQRQQQLSNTSVAASKGTLTSLAGGGSTSNTSTTGITGTTNGNNSSANVGHPNKSKVMHDLFGIETTDSPKTTSSSSLSSTSRRSPPKMDDDDDLFSGLGDARPAKNTTINAKTNNSDFMSSLFGGGGGNKTSRPNSGGGGGTSRDFMLDEKYRTSDGVAAAHTSTASASSTATKPSPMSTSTPGNNMQQPAPRSRRGAPVIASGPSSSGIAIESFKVEANLGTNPSSASAISSSNQLLDPDPVLPKAEQPWLSPTPAQPHPASMVSMTVPSQPSMGMATSASSSTISASI